MFIIDFDLKVKTIIGYQMTIITAKQASGILDVSEATVRNWIKHGYLTPVKNTKSKFMDSEVAALKQRIESGEIKRLRKRANKKKSDISFVPEEYMDDAGFVREIENIRNIFTKHQIDLETSLFVLTLKQLVLSGEVFQCKGTNVLNLKLYNKWKREAVKSELYDWADKIKIDKVTNIQGYRNIYDALTDISHDDTIGIVYQSLMLVGEKSKQGSYYTPREIVDSIFDKHSKERGQYLDPCCGTGQFLLGAVRSGYSDPELLCGYDIDGAAVQIARINLLLAFPDKEFQPQVFKVNTLTDKTNRTTSCETNNLKSTFKLIASNPPWGAAENKEDRNNYRSIYPHITSGESFSLFLSKCIELVEEKGRVSFILPESILNIKIHADIRKYILDNTTIDAIYSLGRKFKGVFTPVIRIDLIKTAAPKDWEFSIYKENRETYKIPQSRFDNNRNFNFDISLSKSDFEILSLLYKKSHVSLNGNAEWALGIVTGNNKKYISSKKGSGTEPVYKGSDVAKYRLKKPSSYIKFTPELFQQVAPEHKYRVSEKLIYKFISNKLSFAYDTNGSLTLNSANILFPGIDGYPIKLVLAFLNSSLYQFIFSKKFNTHKVLRGDLERLPFPVLKDEEKKRILTFVEQAIEGKDVQYQLDLEIMNIIGLSLQQREVILNFTAGQNK
ncbi:MAG: N-6 DNA methylase [Spirochaetes bacterium]|nr:N-6 DNA methylase [Spirochaetota bacterium]